jgi:hypothetical protein
MILSIREYIRERDRVVLGASFEYFREWAHQNTPIGIPNMADWVLERTYHKVRAAHKKTPDKLRQESLEWLAKYDPHRL